MRIRHKLKEYWNKLSNYGSTYNCPVCNYNGRKFLDSGLTSKRKNAKCPSCKSLERHRQLVLIIESLSILKEESLLLHFAPEPCLLTYFKNKLGTNYKTSHYNEKSKSDYIFDIRNIEMPDKSFNFIVCSHVLEHIDEDIKAMKELYRILKPNGIAFIQVPIWPSESHPTYENPQIIDKRDRIINFGQFDHVRIYGLDVIDRLESVGFKVEVVDLCQSLENTKVEKYALTNDSKVRDLTFICRK
jgi:predicted SAM-dependent methyltransferase